MNKILLLGIGLILYTFSPTLSAQQIQETPKQNPVELGKVNWLRDYNKAVAKAQESNLPILVLFQEVPGCSTCSRFGFGPLSDPFLVEAIEDNFIPLAIYNNKRGKDAEILQRFNEPSWNNPVVRIIDTNGNDIVPRMANRWSPSDLLSTVALGIQKTKPEIPIYLSLRLQEAEGAYNLKEANLAMFCFWTGEKEISKIDGVLSTEAGFMHGREIVKVNYDSKKLSLPSLVKKASRAGCADAVYLEDKQDLALAKQSMGVSTTKPVGSYRKDHEVKYYLSKSDLRFVPMSLLQQAKVNAAIGSNQNPDKYLSPRQLLLKHFISERKNTKWASQINLNMDDAWFDLLVQTLSGAMWLDR